MLHVPVQVLFALMVGIPLVFTLGLILFYSMRSAHRSLHSRESIYFCARCGHVYAFARHRPMDRCPHCGTLNEVVRT